MSVYRHQPGPPHLKDSPGAWLNDTQLLVFAAGGQQTAVCIERHAEDDVSVAVDHFHRLAYLQVPDEDLTQSGKIVLLELLEGCCTSIKVIINRDITVFVGGVAVLFLYLVVVACTEEDAAAGGVPLDQTHPSAVTVQLQHCFHHVAPQAALWDLPYSHLQHLPTHTEVVTGYTNIPTGLLIHTKHDNK